LSNKKANGVAPQLDICRLHWGLCKLANQEGIVEYDLETLRRRIFPDNLLINIKYLLTKLELNNIITLSHSQIKLTLWPPFGCGREAKTERFEREPWHNPDPIQKSYAGKDAAKPKKHEDLISKSGLTGLHYPPAFNAFLQAWPNQPIIPDQKKFAWREWDALERSNSLPDVSLLMLTLKTNPPGPRTWPGTWLRKKPWRKPTPKAACKTCNDERIIYGVRPDGTKGAIPCPKCAQ
jgi:hypothetical protein